MRSAKVESAKEASPPYSMDVLKYEAPFLIEKLLKEHIVETREEGEALFTEVKKFCVLVRSDATKLWDMHSLRVDEAWHQFILFTKEYMDFCERFFGTYVPHSPSNAPKSQTMNPPETASFEAFQSRYSELFGDRLPDIWYDEKSVTTNRRVLNDQSGTLTLRDQDGMVDLVDSSGDVMLSVNEFARDALAFIAGTGAFYVRELPGDLSDEEKVALIATLVEYKLLRVGA